MRSAQPAKPMWRQRRMLTLLVWAAWQGHSATSYAAPSQPASDPRGTPTSEAAAEQSLKDAEQHFARGEAHYARGEYDAAATAFHAAFDLTAEPMLLFNEAQAHRLASACGPARERYEQFLRLHAKNDATADLARQHLEQLPSTCHAPSPPARAPGLDLASAPSKVASPSLASAPMDQVHTHHGTTGTLWTGMATVAFAGTATAAWLWNQEQREQLALDEQGLGRLLPGAPGESAADTRRRHERKVDEQRTQVAAFDALTLGAAVAGGIALGVTLYLWLRRDASTQVEAASSGQNLFLAGRF